MDVIEDLVTGEQVSGVLAPVVPVTRRTGFQASEHRHILLALDLLVLNSALLLSLSLRTGSAWRWDLVTGHPLWFLVMSGLWVVFAGAFDAYEPRVIARIQASALATARAALMTVLIYVIIPFITPALPPSRLTAASLPILILAALVLERILYAYCAPNFAMGHRVLIIGTGQSARTMAKALLENGRDSYDVVGLVGEAHGAPEGLSAIDIRLSSQERGRRQGVARLAVLGNWQDVGDVVRAHGVTTLVVSIEDRANAEVLASLIEAAEGGVEVMAMPALYERLTGRVPTEHVGRHWYVALPIHHAGTRTIGRFTKRLLDMFLAGAGLLCFAVVFPIIALAIYLDSGRPIFYVQDRVGKGGTSFKLYKLRSMVRDAENGSAQWAEERDSRVTRVGRFLRATHLDEFPQCFNVLKGEMSAVGPRPERPEFVEQLAVKIPFYRLRHTVKPGMAGWGLVRQGYVGTEQDALVRLQYDLYYIKHQSVWLDLLIMLKTVGHAVTFKGR